MKIKLTKKMIKWSTISLVSAGAVVSAVIVPLVVINSPDENHKKPDKVGDVIVTTIPFSNLTSSIYTYIDFHNEIKKIDKYSITIPNSITKGSTNVSSETITSYLRTQIVGANPNLNNFQKNITFSSSDPLSFTKANEVRVSYMGIDQGISLYTHLGNN